MTNDAYPNTIETLPIYIEEYKMYFNKGIIYCLHKTLYTSINVTVFL